MNRSRTDPLCCAAHPHAIYAGPDGPREPGFSEHRDLGEGSLLWLISQWIKTWFASPVQRQSGDTGTTELRSDLETRTMIQNTSEVKYLRIQVPLLHGRQKRARLLRRSSPSSSRAYLA